MRDAGRGRTESSTAALAVRVRERLDEVGYLLFTDARFESVVSLVVGGPVAGSWWGHPMGGQIYAVAQILDDSSDLLEIPLFFHKTTLVHRRMWPAVVSVAAPRSPWQLADLAPAARALLRQVDREGELRMDGVEAVPLPRQRTTGDLARELERRLLVVGRSVHTPSGRHVKVLASWPHWKSTHAFRGRAVGKEAARAQIEKRAGELFPMVAVRRVVPWGRSGERA
ncbi:MAG: hypothetical protein L3K10_01395 [Thermoplasmata archaeon]|jgi:hypothetical protein|nr:hypothetical protein [Thermoplasmata archaeon]